MKLLYRGMDWLQVLVARWLARHSVALLRVSLGLVFIGFGASNSPSPEAIVAGASVSGTPAVRRR
jgi:hypothetical protein